MRTMLRSVIVVASLTAILGWPSVAVHARASLPLRQDSFFGYSPKAAFFTDGHKIANVRYLTGISLLVNGAGYGTSQASLNTQTLHSYTALTFYLGTDDPGDSITDVGAEGRLTIYRDGQSYRTYSVTQGQPAQLLTVPFDGHTILKFVAQYVSGWASILLASPTAVTIQSSPPYSTGRHVIPRYPTGNAAVSANSAVPFAWQPFPGASMYLFHIWVMNADPSAAITAKTPLTFSTTVYRTTKYTWNDAGFPTGTYQYALMALDAHGKALTRWSTPVQITVAS